MVKKKIIYGWVAKDEKIRDLFGMSKDYGLWLNNYVSKQKRQWPDKPSKKIKITIEEIKGKK